MLPRKSNLLFPQSLLKPRRVIFAPAVSAEDAPVLAHPSANNFNGDSKAAQECSHSRTLPRI
jgi:hypothetical protein